MDALQRACRFLRIKRPPKPVLRQYTSRRALQIEEARAAGAMIVFNHPFCSPECGWKWGFDIAPFDAIEIWNGAMMHENENTRCLDWWHNQLCAGKKIPVTGGAISIVGEQPARHSVHVHLRDVPLPGGYSVCAQEAATAM